MYSYRSFILVRHIGHILSLSSGSGLGHATRVKLLRPEHALTQVKKFDPNGDCVRRWVPELAQLPTRLCTALGMRRILCSATPA